MARAQAGLAVAVTGPTGTLGSALVPLLQADPRVARIVGIARRPFEPAERGWTKMAYRRGDVRDRAALEAAFQGVDAVIHLAFVITGMTPQRTAHGINIHGTLNAFRAGAAAGVHRFVYASSVAAYGFHRDNPVGMAEDWPVRPADRLFYAQDKADLERLLQAESRAHPALDLYLLRPPIVLGPHAMGAKDLLPGPLAWLGRRLAGLVRPVPLPLPLPVPALPVQFIHEDDVARAFLLCTVGAGPPGAYNITGDGVATTADVARAFGFRPLPLPAGPAHAAARVLSALPPLPFTPPAVQWIEALSHPSIMDASKAKRELGWQATYSSLEAVRSTIARQP